MSNNHDDFAASIGATPADDHEDFAASIGATPAESASPSGGEAFGRGVKQGATMGWGDEASGGIDAILAKLGGLTDANKKLADEGFHGDVGPATMGETYKAGRDEERAANKAAKDAHPWMYGSGNVAGGIVSGAATGGALAAGKGAGLASTLIRGAGAGMVGGAGGSDADNVKDLSRDTLVGAGLGAGMAGGGYGAGKAATGLRDFAKGRAVAALKGNMRDEATLAAKGVSDELGGELLDNGVVGYGRGIKGMQPKLESLLNDKGAELGAIRQSVDDATPHGAIDLSSLARKGQTMQAIPGQLPEDAAVASAYGNSADAIAAAPQRTVAETQQLIKRLGENAGFGRPVLGDAAKEQANRELRGDLVSKVDDQIRQLRGQDVLDRSDALKNQYSLFKDADGIVSKAAARQAANSPIALRDLAAAASGDGSIKKLLLGLASKVARERGNSTLAAGANDASKLLGSSDVINGIQDQAGTLSQNSPDIAEYLRAKGLIK